MPVWIIKDVLEKVEAHESSPAGSSGAAEEKAEEKEEAPGIDIEAEGGDHLRRFLQNCSSR